MKIAMESWLRKALAFYRPRGFFRQIQGDLDEVSKKLLPYLNAQNEGEAISFDDLESPEFDLFLLSCDPFRALYDGMEYGDALTEGNNAYVATVHALAKISRGVFLPKDVKETWDSPEGPIRITFQFDGAERTLKVDTWDGMFDFRILLQLNQLLWKTEFRFEMAPLDDILFVTVLKAQEKTDMEKDRDLSFMVLDLPRTFHPLHSLKEPLTLPEDPQAPIFYVGTLNENLDRCIGRLRLILRGETLEGHHLYQGEAHQEDFKFTGRLQKETGAIQGTLKGFINVGTEQRPYAGVWQGQLAAGHLVATGTWQGWFVSDIEEGKDKPKEDHQIYKGQWGVLEEDFFNTKDLYIERIKAWLESVWVSKNNDDYPWLMPLV